ncbi:hypothetical protein T02_2513 [Trichinella nativa]|uniref:Uncharacterized protein n=1 Tax=Trichinella nativa TaxID=6335 RepID=A0A0V1L9S8_9BILA|nr:hypothetical protein T02_2513 [Trichinella nativa]
MILPYTTKPSHVANKVVLNMIKRGSMPDETTVREIDGYSKRQRVPLTSTASRMLMTACVCSQGIYKAQPPMSGSIKADNLAIFPFGVIVRQAASSKYFVENRHNGVNSHCHPSTSAHGVSLTPTGAAICRDNDLADGVRVLSSSYPRLSATSPWPGHTD